MKFDIREITLKAFIQAQSIIRIPHLVYLSIRGFLC